jgi:hypothetical protein
MPPLPFGPSAGTTPLLAAVVAVPLVSPGVTRPPFEPVLLPSAPLPLPGGTVPLGLPSVVPVLPAPETIGIPLPTAPGALGTPAVAGTVTWPSPSEPELPQLQADTTAANVAATTYPEDNARRARREVFGEEVMAMFQLRVGRPKQAAKLSLDALRAQTDR